LSRNAVKIYLNMKLSRNAVKIYLNLTLSRNAVKIYLNMNLQKYYGIELSFTQICTHSHTQKQT